MKAITFLFIISIMSLTNLHAQTKANKALVVCFSHSGNTKVIAEYISEATGGDLFEIKPVVDYPADYNTVVEQARKEINAGYKPELKSKVPDIEKYDVIFVGSPNWWSTIAPPVATFLSSYDLKGKKIIPFITHGGGGMGHSVADIKKLCPGSEVLNGYACSGSSVRNAGNDVIKWVKGLNILFK
jgi:flavodoxin